MLILIEQAQKLWGSMPDSSSLSSEELLPDFFCLCVSVLFSPISNFPKILVTLLFFQFYLFGMLMPNNPRIRFLFLFQWSTSGEQGVGEN